MSFTIRFNDIVINLRLQTVTFSLQGDARRRRLQKRSWQLVDPQKDKLEFKYSTACHKQFVQVIDAVHVFKESERIRARSSLRSKSNFHFLLKTVPYLARREKDCMCVETGGLERRYAFESCCSCLI